MGAYQSCVPCLDRDTDSFNENGISIPVNPRHSTCDHIPKIKVDLVSELCTQCVQGDHRGAWSLNATRDWAGLGPLHPQALNAAAAPAPTAAAFAALVGGLASEDEERRKRKLAEASGGGEVAPAPARAAGVRRPFMKPRAAGGAPRQE